MKIQSKTKASGTERVPPGFGEGKSWRLRRLEWFARDPKNPDGKPLGAMAMVKQGMPVHEKLHAAYWEARDTSAKAIAAYRAAGIDPPYFYGLFDRSCVISGCGEFEADDTPDDMAWMSCMFLEMSLRMAFPMTENPEGPQELNRCDKGQESVICCPPPQSQHTGSST
jgi:hypothetical protein